LKREIVSSAFAALSWSTISQPVSSVMAPRLVAPRRKTRRDGSGSSFAASLISSLHRTLLRFGALSRRLMGLWRFSVQ
jgi:hypothetical protein